MSSWTAEELASTDAEFVAAARARIAELGRRSPDETLSSWGSDPLHEAVTALHTGATAISWYLWAAGPVRISRDPWGLGSNKMIAVR